MKSSAVPRNTIARNPSHFGSYRYSPCGGSSSASFASIGSTGGTIGNSPLGNAAIAGIVGHWDKEPPCSARGVHFVVPQPCAPLGHLGLDSFVDPSTTGMTGGNKNKR